MSKHYNSNQIRVEDINEKWDVRGFPRMQIFFDQIEGLAQTAKVLDYGCNHGGFAEQAAKEHPYKTFTGVDMLDNCIKMAKARSSKHSYKNLEYLTTEDWKKQDDKYDAIVLMEVLEHIPNFRQALMELEARCEGEMWITVPHGPWEYLTCSHEAREHFHHFEMRDILDVFGKKKQLHINYVSDNNKAFSTPCGQWAITYKADREPPGFIDYERKIREQYPKKLINIYMLTPLFNLSQRIPQYGIMGNG